MNSKVFQYLMIVGSIFLISSSSLFLYFFYRDSLSDEEILTNTEGECTPYEIRFLAIEATYADVEWKTDEECFSYAKLSKFTNKFDSALTIDSTEPVGHEHRVNIQSLEPEATYYLIIYSEGNAYGDNGLPLEITTKSL